MSSYQSSRHDVIADGRGARWPTVKGRGRGRGSFVHGRGRRFNSSRGRSRGNSRGRGRGYECEGQVEDSWHYHRDNNDWHPTDQGIGGKSGMDESSSPFEDLSWKYPAERSVVSENGPGDVLSGAPLLVDGHDKEVMHVNSERSDNNLPVKKPRELQSVAPAASDSHCESNPPTAVVHPAAGIDSKIREKEIGKCEEKGSESSHGIERKRRKEKVQEKSVKTDGNRDSETRPKKKKRPRKCDSDDDLDKTSKSEKSPSRKKRTMSKVFGVPIAKRCMKLYKAVKVLLTDIHELKVQDAFLKIIDPSNSQLGEISTNIVKKENLVRLLIHSASSTGAELSAEAPLPPRQDTESSVQSHVGDCSRGLMALPSALQLDEDLFMYEKPIVQILKKYHPHLRDTVLEFYGFSELLRPGFRASLLTLKPLERSLALCEIKSVLPDLKPREVYALWDATEQGGRGTGHASDMAVIWGRLDARTLKTNNSRLNYFLQAERFAEPSQGSRDSSKLQERNPRRESPKIEVLSSDSEEDSD